MFIYAALSVTCLILFGSSIKTDFMLNFADLKGNFSTFAMIVFLLIQILRIPFMYVPPKESIMVLYEEFTNKTVSLRIEKRLQESPRFRNDDN